MDCFFPGKGRHEDAEDAANSWSRNRHSYGILEPGVVLSYSAPEFTSQIGNKANPKINFTVFLIKEIHSFRKAT